MNPAKFNNIAIREYLRLMEETESPRMMHVWSCLSCASAAMGRRIWYDLDIAPIYGNTYILLVGPPGCRKSTAINLATSLLKNTKVNYAPDDTGGQRQGLLAAMLREETPSEEEGIESFAKQMEELLTEEITLDEKKPITPDANVMYIKAGEFGGFMGENRMDLARFMVKMYDGDDYTYTLKNSHLAVREPLLSMIGGTTPTDISLILPPEAIGQGFMSRIILVFAPGKYQRISRPRALDPGRRQVFEDAFTWIGKQTGQLKETREAQLLIDKLYHNKVEIRDHRFVHYLERRHTHLIKLVMAMCVLRRSLEITPEDVADAQYLLTETEKNMPDALGQYGLSPLSLARQKLVEFLQHARTPVPKRVLWQIMSRDMKGHDFEITLSDLLNAGQITLATVRGIGHCYLAKKPILDEAQTPLSDDQVRELLSQDSQFEE